jgi:hypothetical protein
VLPAPPSSTPPHRTASGDKLFATRELLFAAALLAYAMLLGGALMNGILAPERAFWFLALPCIVPAIWYSVAYFNPPSRRVAARGAGSTPGLIAGERDSGVLLSAAGWFLIAIALVFKQIAVIKAGSDAYALQATSPMVPVGAAFGVLCLLLGAVFSWLFWAAQDDETNSRIGTHY